MWWMIIEITNHSRKKTIIITCITVVSQLIKDLVLKFVISGAQPLWTCSVYRSYVFRQMSLLSFFDGLRLLDYWTAADLLTTVKQTVLTLNASKPV